MTFALLLLVLLVFLPVSPVLADGSGADSESSGSGSSDELEETERDEEEDDDDAEESDGGDIEIRFLLPELRASPGEEIEIPLEIQTTVPLAMISFSVEYDPRVLEFLEPRLSPEVSALLEAHAPTESLFEWFRSQDEPGDDEEPDDEEEDDDEDEEWLQVSIVTDFEARPEFSIPAGRQRIVYLRFKVVPGAPTGRYDLEFSTETNARFQGKFVDVEGKAVYNVVGIEGQPLTTGLFDAAAQAGIRGGAIVVAPLIGDIGVFQRGDVNLDAAVDVSDPMATIGHLFLGRVARVCPVTADVDVDGTLQLTDAIVILNHLFLAGESWRPEPVFLPQPGDVTQPSAALNGCVW